MKPGQSDDNNVIGLEAKKTQRAVAQLNRQTGLNFEGAPESLLAKGGLQLAGEDGEELIYRALYLWGE